MRYITLFRTIINVRYAPVSKVLLSIDEISRSKSAESHLHRYFRASTPILIGTSGVASFRIQSLSLSQRNHMNSPLIEPRFLSTPSNIGGHQEVH